MSCSVCGAPRAPLEGGRCVNREGCNARRIARRIHDDKKRGAPQCMASIGSASIRFCVMGKDHVGPHAQGVTEWSSKESSPAGEAFAACMRRAVSR